MVLNTTNGAVEAPRGARSYVNTTSLLEPPEMRYSDESPEIIAVVAGGNWCALVEGVAVPMPLWVALDDGSVYGVVIGEDGLLDPQVSVETHPHFSGYTHGNFNDKEK
jgi:hypothetical protein